MLAASRNQPGGRGSRGTVPSGGTGLTGIGRGRWPESHELTGTVSAPVAVECANSNCASLSFCRAAIL
jgi:hypothetical protein